jgi:formylglycine-generating enzyme required for sulfatase activity
MQVISKRQLRFMVRPFCVLSCAFLPAIALAQSPASYVEKVPGTLLSIEMMQIPGGTVQQSTPNGPRTVEIAPFWIAKTEVAWELYDVFVFGLDTPASRPEGADAVARPSKPYVQPGEQFGHKGHPAVGMTYHAARSFAQWLSQVSGRKYRLPTEAEWEWACRAGKSEPEIAASLAERAWYAQNSERRTHLLASRAANATGVHDLLGNVAEWVSAESDSVIKGGSYDDRAEQVRCSARRQQTPAWNETDPQLPKSRWWLPDAPFAGFRLVRER